MRVVPHGKAPPALSPPKPLPPIEVEADTIDEARRAIRKRFEGQGRIVRNLSVLADGKGLSVTLAVLKTVN